MERAQLWIARYRSGEKLSLRMEKIMLNKGDIVQISPEVAGGTKRFGACLMVVTEPRAWGAIGYVKSAGSSGVAFFRVEFKDIERTGGHVIWKWPTSDAEEISPAPGQG